MERMLFSLLYSKLTRFLSFIFFLSLLIFSVLHLPGIPYNVKELFVQRSIIWGVFCFSLFLIWTCSAPVYAGLVIAHKPRLDFFLPVAVLLIGIPGWMLLRYSVSTESLWDIVGFPVLSLRPIFGIEDWEIFGRYIALAAIPTWCLLMASLAHEAIRRGEPDAVVSGFAFGIPSLCLSKLVIFDFAATDNLKELFFPSLTAPISVLASCFIVAFLGVTLGKGKRSAFFSLGLAPFGIFIAWNLLRMGLKPEAIEFLLSPDRQLALPQAELFNRWCIVSSAAIGLIAICSDLAPTLTSVSSLWDVIKNEDDFADKVPRGVKAALRKS